ncbi:putative transcription factor WD40-like family [Lupinus albus]|uniref:Putative transcription factor WD40-like family n=1 Tax=Lupinus albus TaxID=3870 RepID=A0A6A4R5M1_LUPAL|nr:putative transcription factor WD40-like family [Lupinus albus]
MIHKANPFWCVLAMIILCASMICHHKFAERGKIFTKQEVRAIQLGPGGIFFTGDGTGQVKVWNWIAEPTTSIQ